MRAWRSWRPYVSYGGLVVALVAFLVMRDGPPADPFALVATFAATMTFVAFLVERVGWKARSFLRGLADGGVPTELVDERVGWLGDREVKARSREGDWLLSVSAGKSPRLSVRGPHMERRSPVLAGARKAGRSAAHALRNAPRKDEFPFAS